MSLAAPDLRIVLATILCLLLQVGWGAEESDSDPILQEYYRLLDLANNGEASDKVSLFLYTAKHGTKLEEQAESALMHLVEASNAGYGEASFWIGHLSENGILMDQSDQGAMIFYVLSAQQGFDKGMHACVSYFGKAAIKATSDADREEALINAQNWYDALSAIREETPAVFASARFNLAIARLKLDPTDEYGMTLLGEAAVDGHPGAATLIRKFYMKGLSTNYGENENFARLMEIWSSTIEVIGPDETGAR